MKTLFLSILLLLVTFGCFDFENNNDNRGWKESDFDLATFEQIDTDGNGSISDEEYAHWVAIQQ